MFCDRTAASMTYLKDKYNDSSALEYYRKNQAITMFHPDTEKQLVYLLEYQRDHGLDATLKNQINAFRISKNRNSHSGLILYGYASLNTANQSKNNKQLEKHEQGQNQCGF